MRDLETEEIRASVRRGLFGEEDPPTVGRYRIANRLGRGGMGVVYAADDPELERRVALKVLRPLPTRKAERTGDRRARLVREARAMAKLAHPNVVSVFEVGTVDDQVYVAMELVDGPTLQQWLRDETRTWRDVVDVFVDAGMGLEAAHAVGLVHRDFKPENVIVGNDGRVRVLDFGLARAGSASIESEITRESWADSGDSFTRTGTVLGTPAYMAPEQRRGETTELSDQFSFCVALTEALTGRRPGASEDSAPGVPSRAPAAVGQVLARGLESEPSRRWPSMQAMLDALRLAMRSRRRWSWAAGAAMTAAVVLWLGSGSEPQNPCAIGSKKAAAVWPGTHAEPIERVVANGSPLAAKAWPRTRSVLEQRLEAWRSAYDASCEARSDWQLFCLDAQLGEIETIVEGISRGDLATLEHASAALGELDPARTCSEARAARGSVVEIPAQQRQDVRAIKLQLAEVSALIRTGRVLWCQEEPRNQGAWRAIRHRIERILQDGQSLGYAGRAPSPSPAVGYASVHAIQQRELVEQALGGDGSAS